MTLGKITGNQTFNENDVFTGMDITARFLNRDNKYNTLSFHYAFYTKDLRGRVESVLHTVLNNLEVPINVSDVKVE